jgi:hypothetical protein
MTSGAPGTFGAMQLRVADELGGRTDLLVPQIANQVSSPIQMAILDAVMRWQDSRFWFNEYRVAGAFNTVRGQEFYTAADWPDIATIQHIDIMTVVVSGNRYKMWPRTVEYIERISTNQQWTGMPVDYSYYDFTIRMYPIPNGVYPINVLGTQWFAPLNADTDSNVWTTFAASLIKSTAKLYLYRDTLQDDERAQAMQNAVQFELMQLRAATQRRSATTRMVPTYF